MNRAQARVAGWRPPRQSGVFWEHGIFAVNKPAGITSAAALNQIKSELFAGPRIKRPKLGHAGTLDLACSGILVVGVGDACRDLWTPRTNLKVYEARAVLGKVARDSHDVWSEKLTDGDPNLAQRITQPQLEDVLQKFVGEIHQTPPVISSLKVQGTRLRDLAATGREVTKPPRPISIFSLELMEFCAPNFRIRVSCGSGTYVRTLLHDIGHRLGCGAVMTELVRTRQGPFCLEDPFVLPVERWSTAELREALRAGAEHWRSAQ